MSFVGPSYNLNTRGADVQRVVNMFPVVNEVKGGKNFAYLDAVPGLVRFSVRAGDAILLEDEGYLALES
jgi:hypothetical protein